MDHHDRKHGEWIARWRLGASWLVSLALGLALGSCTGSQRSRCGPGACLPQGARVPCEYDSTFVCTCVGGNTENYSWTSTRNPVVTIGAQLTYIETKAAGDPTAAAYLDDILCKCQCNKARPRQGTEQTSKSGIRSAYEEALKTAPNWFSVREDLNAADN